MKKEFVPYIESLELKELGFDEPCIKEYHLEELLNNSTGDEIKNSELIKLYGESCVIAAPLYQQAFRWFIDNYGLDCSFEDNIVEDENDNEIQMWEFFIYKTKQKSDNKLMDFCSNNFHTYIESYTIEQAELECIRQLIKIAKEKK